MSTAWFNPFSGIAGDMALGALVDAGADLDRVVAILDGLHVDGWSVRAEAVLRAGVGGTHLHVDVEETDVARTWSDIDALLGSAALPERVRRRARAVFAALAEAEGRVHRMPPADVHFHEVGALDAIVDVVGTCAALEVLGVDRVASAPVANGVGTVRAAHGVLPNPAPAVVELLRGAPTFGVDLAMELTTPTGAAILAALCESWGPAPAMTISAVGYGAGTRDLHGRPNVTQVVLGDPRVVGGPPPTGQPVALLEANLDDATGETLAHTVAQLMGAGAHDAWITPVVMKKGRPAHTVHVLCDPSLAPQLRDVLAAETGTLGVRGQTMERWPARRSTTVVHVDGHPVRVKVSPGRVKAEHDDAAAVAARLGRPLRDVAASAEAAVPADPHPHPHPHPHP